MKILLLGKDGQVGIELQRSLIPLGELIVIGRKEVDLTDLVNLDIILHKYAPNVIVNAAAYTKVDKAENDKATVFKVNVEAVDLIAKYSKHNNTLLIHYSTDYVFDGEKKSSYIETDSTNPINTYGQSKVASEEAIMREGSNFIIFRTSWVFSIHGNNFIKTIFQLAKERKSLNIVADQYGAPTSAKLIADVTALAIFQYAKKLIKNGIYHLTASDFTSWYGFAYYIIEQALHQGANFMLQTQNIYPILTEEYLLPAKRPKNSKLDTSKLSRTLGIDLPNWKIHVNEVITQLIQLQRGLGK